MLFLALLYSQVEVWSIYTIFTVTKVSVIEFGGKFCSPRNHLLNFLLTLSFQVSFAISPELLVSTRIESHIPSHSYKYAYECGLYSMKRYPVYYLLVKSHD